MGGGCGSLRGSRGALGAIQAFAGDDYDTPVLEPRALELLSRYDRKAQHFDTRSFGR